MLLEITKKNTVRKTQEHCFYEKTTNLHRDLTRWLFHLKRYNAKKLAKIRYSNAVVVDYNLQNVNWEEQAPKK